MDEIGGGSLTVPGALLALVLVMAAGLGLDGVRKAQQIATADSIAEEAARVGAQQLDIAALRRGEIRLDPARAAVEAQRYLDRSGATGSIAVVGNDRVRVRAVVRRSTVLLGLIGIDELDTHGSAESEPLLMPSGVVA